MSVFGGDSWAREAQQRKRRVDDLLLSDASSSSSYKKLSSGKYACLICSNNPVLDSPLMLSMHLNGSRHIAAETRLKQQELSRRDELNKRIALCADSFGVPSSGITTQPPKYFVGRNKPLVEQARIAILATQCDSPHKLNAAGSYHSKEPSLEASPSNQSKFLRNANDTTRLSLNPKSDIVENRKEMSSTETEATGKSYVEWHEELCKQQEKELKFTEAGWKRDCNGKWYRDENVMYKGTQATTSGAVAGHGLRRRATWLPDTGGDDERRGGGTHAATSCTA